MDITTAWANLNSAWTAFQSAEENLAKAAGDLLALVPNPLNPTPGAAPAPTPGAAPGAIPAPATPINASLQLA